MNEIEDKLAILYDLMVDNYKDLRSDLSDLISSPKEIADTNKFASLLVQLNNTFFIRPLLVSISKSSQHDAWVSDFLYAVNSLLEESDEDFSAPPNLIKKLETWILKNKNELSWKAANLLRFYESSSAEKIQLKKLEERGDFFLTYGECILGLLNYDKGKHIELVKSIARDPSVDEQLREFAEDALNN